MEVRLPPRWVTVSILVTTLALCAGCRKPEEAPASDRARDAPAADSSVTSASDMTGIWTVVGHRIPGISAMSDVEAAAWQGQTVRLTAAQALTVENHCDEPTYATRTVEGSSFLGSEFKLPPGSLTALDSLERLTLLEVSCSGAPWAALGGRLIGIDADHVLAPWDGVFFELARGHDFLAAGQEPLWRLEIRKGKEIMFTAVGKADVVTPVPTPETDQATGIRIYHAVTEANDLRVVIEPAGCTDVMSGKAFDTTVTVALNRQTYHGCGGAPE